MSRSEKQNKGDIFYYKWDVANQTIDEEAVLKADYIIHLAGENIAEKDGLLNEKQQLLTVGKNLLN